MNNISVRINNTDTQDNANGLYIRILEADEITDIYNEHIVTDFPASEVKPLSQMLRKREQGQYFVYGMFEDNGELAGYAYFIKCSNKDVYLLDYLAIVKNKRSKHLGSTFLQELKNIAVNADYADEGAAKDYMIKRIGFYKKNGMKLSNTSCYFLGNEYRILYAGDEVEDDYMDEITDTVYRDFFGDQFVDMNVRFH